MNLEAPKQRINDLVVMNKRLYEIRAITSGEYRYLCVNVEDLDISRREYAYGFAMNEKFEMNEPWQVNKSKIRHIGKASEHPEYFV